MIKLTCSKINITVEVRMTTNRITVEGLLRISDGSDTEKMETLILLFF